MASWLRKIGRKALRAARKTVPGLDLALDVGEGLTDIAGITGGGGGGGLKGVVSTGSPPVPTSYMGGPMAAILKGAARQGGYALGTMGANYAWNKMTSRGGTRPPMGPTGPAGIPSAVPPEYLKQFSIDNAYLRTSVRAPAGYVVLRDSQGRPFAVNKRIAQSFRLWKPKKKPPISVRDWQALLRAQRTVNKLKTVVKRSKVVTMTPRRTIVKKAC